ncbi:matrixin family metalloprotease [Sorangium atrum]|uniref:Matrixin family metalloprotease n=1 Tax=Sorangium atrum TaxID=2995308 RepID=A0ABT5C569_9BACT|nr:matrixin family metalloprotease [Sorangium aterium]MDC0680346.1 matrixin family metalloprotease [Sorangium aterium]
MRRHVALAALLGAASSLAVAREAAAWVPLDDVVPRWDKLPVAYYINRSTIPGEISAFAVARVESGFETWSNAGCTEWRVDLLGDTTDRYNYNDGKNVFHWISSSWPNMLGDVNSVIGVTMPVWSFNGAIVDADMVFNDVGFCWNDTGNNGCVDTQSIATHEEGHFLGLGHSSERSATMTPYYVVGSSMRTIEQDDIDGVCALYPIGGTTAANAASATSAAAGGGGCDSCSNDSLANNCKAPYDACGASLACRRFIGCINECPDDACVEGCLNDQPEGADMYISILECVCGECSTECSTECAGFDGGGAGGAGGSGGDGGAGGSSTSTSSSAGGGSSVGATASSSVASSGGVGGGGGADPDDTQKSGDGESGGDAGCSCSTTGRSADVGGVMLLGVLGALASRRRRR